MTIQKLQELMVLIDDHYGRFRTKEERKADVQIYIHVFGKVPDEVAEQALYSAFTQSGTQYQLLPKWDAEVKKLQTAELPSANDLWKAAATAARRIEANLYYQTHGGLMTSEGKITGEEFKKRNAEIFAALPAVVQQWAGSPVDLSEIFTSRSTADLRQFVRPGFDRAVADAPIENLQPPLALQSGEKERQRLEAAHAQV